MSNLYFILSLLIIASCTSNEYIEVAQLPTYQGKFVLNDTSLMRFNFSAKYISKNIEEQIDSALNIDAQYLALAKFHLPGKFSEKERTFDLVLLRLEHDTVLINILVTIKSSNNKLIDILDFKEGIWKFNAVYPDTSLELQDVFAIEILEDRSSIDKIYVKQHRFDVIRSGQIEYKYTESDIRLIFFTLNDICTYCGIYIFNSNKLSVRAEVRQGTKPETLAYYFILTSPTECAEHYVRFENELINGVMTINNHIEMEFDSNQLTFKIKDYKDGCDEMLDGDFILKKTR